MKPALLGMNNPHSDDPKKALGVDPPNASGHRLWSMMWEASFEEDPPLDVTPELYENGFDRYNLVQGRIFHPDLFSMERQLKVEALLRDRVVVMCGTNVPRMMGVKYNGFDLKPLAGPSYTYYVIPHPSGLCRNYNDRDVRIGVGRLLIMLYKLGAAHP